MNIIPEIIYEDQELLVCRKPAGIPVQTAKTGQQDLVSLLKNYRMTRKEEPQIYVLHRLDQPVEGIMVFAKCKEAAACLSRQIQEKSVDKYYFAVVEGTLSPTEGTLTDYLLRDGKSNISRVVPEGTKGAKRAVLSYKVMQTAKEKSLVEIRLETGRHHQIRVQMAKAGHPLAGDKKYNPDCADGYMPIGLCSVKLSFRHPATGAPLSYSLEPKGAAFREFFPGV